MGWEKEIEEFGVRRAHSRLAVRTHIEALVDEGSFREQGGLAGVSETDAEGGLLGFQPAGAVVGTARIDGRPVVACGGGFTPGGGAAARVALRKDEYADRLSVRRRIPNVRLLEGAPATASAADPREPSETDFVAGDLSGLALLEARASVPLVAAALGPVTGSGATRLVAAHFSCQLGGSDRGSPLGPGGVADNLADDEADAWRQIRRFLSYLPSNVWEAAPVAECHDPRDRAEESLLTLVSRERDRPYAMRRVVEAVVDTGSLFEIGAGRGHARITALARLNGHPVGIVADDTAPPGAGATPDGARKLRRFAELCDGFHLPIVAWVDEPASAGAAGAEHAATLRHAAEARFAVLQTEVPWFGILVRRSLAARGALPIGPRGSVVAWPSARAEAGGGEASSIFPQAEAFEINDLIDPRETRARLCDWIDDIGPVLALQRGPRAYAARP